jgi:hypothetical protein
MQTDATDGCDPERMLTPSTGREPKQLIGSDPRQDCRNRLKTPASMVCPLGQKYGKV